MRVGSRRLESRYPVGRHERNGNGLWLYLFPCLYREVMIHKKPLLCNTSTGPVPITAKKTQYVKKVGVRERV
jgi:hypothetical protein